MDLALILDPKSVVCVELSRMCALRIKLKELSMSLRIATLAGVLALALACQSPPPKTPDAGTQPSVKTEPVPLKPEPKTITGVTPAPTPTPKKPVAPTYVGNDKLIITSDITTRTAVADKVYIRHIMLPWDKLAKWYRMRRLRVSAEASKRTKEQADKLVKELYEQAKKGDDFKKLMARYSEDPGTAKIGRYYEISSRTRFPFKAMALRMKPNEVGIARSRFGWHVLKRVLPDPPDPLETLSILKRKAQPVTGKIHLWHIQLAWDALAPLLRRFMDPRAKTRTADATRKLVKEILDTHKKGEKFHALMKKYNEDKRMAQRDEPMVFTHQTRMFPQYLEMVKRMNLNEVGVVKTWFGWFIIKRVPPPPPDPLESHNILKRKDAVDFVVLDAILVSWKQRANNPYYARRLTDEAKKRSKEDADKRIAQILTRLKKGDKWADVKKEFNDDKQAQKKNEPLRVTDLPYVPASHRRLGLRLKVNEVGVVKHRYGFYVMKRLPEPPRDPLESAEILKRKPIDVTSDKLLVQAIAVTWKEAAPKGFLGRRYNADALKRSKEDADKQVKKVLERLKKGDKFLDVRKELSDEKRAGRGTPTPLNGADSRAARSGFRRLAKRLKLNETGVIKGQYGFYIIKRVPPPPPDPLESSEILKRKPVTASAKVKHILIAWKGLRPRQDPRAMKRTKADADKLVKSLMALLKKGGNIDALMKEHSEDPGSAKTGRAYTVTPSARLVPAFKNLGLRLNKKEVGAVKTVFGWHVIQRVE